jgi:hypothetical protein
VVLIVTQGRCQFADFDKGRKNFREKVSRRLRVLLSCASIAYEAAGFSGGRRCPNPL